MKNEEYIKSIKTPQIWFEFYRQQKQIAEILLEKLLSKEQLSKIKENIENSNFTVVFSNAHYHWGIAIENGLKGLIIKKQPDAVEYELSQNYIRLKSICGKAGKTHNLLKLADIANIFDKNNGIYQHEFCYEILKQVLLHLTDMVKWGARYPFPNNTATIFKIKEGIPPKLIYGFHILDTIEPLFAYLDKES